MTHRSLHAVVVAVRTEVGAESTAVVVIAEVVVEPTRHKAASLVEAALVVRAVEGSVLLEVGAVVVVVVVVARLEVVALAVLLGQIRGAVATSLLLAFLVRVRL